MKLSRIPTSAQRGAQTVPVTTNPTAPIITEGENPRRAGFPRGISFVVGAGVGTQAVGRHSGSRAEVRAGIRIPITGLLFGLHPFGEVGAYFAATLGEMTNSTGDSRVSAGDSHVNTIGGGIRGALGLTYSSPWGGFDVSPYLAAQFGLAYANCGNEDQLLDLERLRSLGPVPADVDRRTGQGGCQLYNEGPAFHRTGDLTELSGALGLTASARYSDGLRFSAFAELGGRRSSLSAIGNSPNDITDTEHSLDLHVIGGLGVEIGATGQIQTDLIVTRQPTVPVTDSMLSADRTSLVIPGNMIAGAMHYGLVHAHGDTTRHPVPSTGDLLISTFDLDDVIGIDFTDNAASPHTLRTFNISSGFVNHHLVTPQPNGDVVIMGVGTLINVPSMVTLPSPAGRPVPLTTLVVPGNARIMEGTSVRIRLDGQDVGPVIPIPGQEPDPNRDQTSVAITLPENTTASHHACEILLNIPSSRPRILKSLSLTVQPAVSQAPAISQEPVVTQQPVPVTRHTITPRRPSVPRRPVQPADSDHDGVPDSQDLCNNTASGAEVIRTTARMGCAPGEIPPR